MKCKRFISTSITRGWAETQLLAQYRQNREARGQLFLLEIELPKGTHVAVLDEQPHFLDSDCALQEKELLLPRNLTFETVGRAWNRKYKTIKLRLISDDYLQTEASVSRAEKSLSILHMQFRL